jgi:protein SCO1/2
MNKIIYAIIAFISIIAGAVGFYFLSQAKQLPSPESALYYPNARAIPAFTLTDELAQPFSNQQLVDKWSFAFLGYTSCPDVCPMTLQKLNLIFDDLTTIAGNTQILLVSADPKRDTTEKLSQYIAYFNNDFKALRAEHDVLFPFSRSLGLMYAITTKENTSSVKEDESYWVDHSASLVLINPAGKIAAIFKPEQAVGVLPSIDSEKLLSDYQKVVALYEG